MSDYVYPEGCDVIISQQQFTDMALAAAQWERLVERLPLSPEATADGVISEIARLRALLTALRNILEQAL